MLFAPHHVVLHVFPAVVFCVWEMTELSIHQQEHKYDFLRLDLLINRFDGKKQHLGYTGAHKCRNTTYFSSLNVFSRRRLSLLSN